MKTNQLAGQTPDGAHADILGTLVRCAEPHADRPCYTREGHGGKWAILLWWHAKSRQWVLGRRSDKGTKKGWIRVESDAPSPVGLADWQVWYANAWEPARLACTLCASS